MHKVGLLVGREWSFPPALIQEVQHRDEGVTVELVKLGGTAMDEPRQYDVLVDRISHEVPYYRSYLKHAVLSGTRVVNNPFMWTADDKFFGSSLATKLGIAHPKTLVLPNREYVPGIVHDESLRNLVYPLDWDAIIAYVGMPCILKDAHGGGWKDVFVCRSRDELLQNYNTSGLLTMVVQEFIEWDHFIRCICIGQEKVLPIKYDPRERRYHVAHDHMSAELGKRVVSDSLRLVRALGYDMNSMEWAVRDGIPYAIDFMNPAPDMDVNSLTPHYFDWVVKAMADMVIAYAKDPQPQVHELKWSQLFAGSRVAGSPARSAEQRPGPDAARGSRSISAGDGSRTKPPSANKKSAPKAGSMQQKQVKQDHPSRAERKSANAEKLAGGIKTPSGEGQGTGRGKGKGRPKNPGHRA
jgi:hypothetical protein